MTSLIKRQDNGTIEVHLTFPWAEIQAGYVKQVDKAVEDTELPGFRKGKAPRDMVESKLDKTQVYSQALQEVLPEAYAEAIKQHGLAPILYPRIHIEKGQENQDWEVVAYTCEAPTAELPADWKDAVKKLPKEPTDSMLGRTIEQLKTTSTVKIPDILVEEEANHRLASLAENLTKIGVSTQTYMETKKLTPETLKAQFSQEARIDLEVEFILEHIRREEKLADRPKTLDFLKNLVQA